MSNREESESSNLQFLISSPDSSPFQLVPVLVPAHDSHLQQTIYSGDTSNNSNEHGLHLRVLIQPQEYFRFRYKSERDGGTHGYLLGECLAPESPDSPKTFPTVELRNYSCDAVIKCQLYQHDKYEEHPHTLQEDKRGDPMAKVSEKKGYTVCFPSLDIIHTAKRDVVRHLYDKLKQRMSEDELKNLSRAKLREKCKKIDLNRVRLRFSAHDMTTDKELCVVYSKTIKNSRKIKVNFFETNSEQERVWEQPAIIHEVHRQYGIYISTPPYKEITSDVNVWMELQRLTDGSRSKPRQFTYTPEPRHLLRKRARIDDDPVQPIVNVPIVVPAEIVYKNFENPSSGGQTSNGSFELTNPIVEHEEAKKQEDLLDEFSFFGETYNDANNQLILPVEQPPDHDMPLQQINNVFHDIDEVLEFKDFLTNHRDPLLSQTEYALYPLSGEDICEFMSAEFAGALPRLVSDAPRPAGHEGGSGGQQREHLLVYTLIREICELKRMKLREWYEEITEKLEKLFEIELSNGDTILHMLLEEDEACLRGLVALSSSLRRRHLPAARDGRGLSVLHHAAILRRNQLLTYLVLKGCDPLCPDMDRNNVIHHAVRSGADTLATLLQAMAASGDDMERKLAQCNDEGQTPLHLAVSEGDADCAKLLLSWGGSARQSRDAKGWSPLHTAVQLDRPDLVQIILDSIPEEGLEATDAATLTGALQLACGGAGPRGEQVARLLLDRGASATVQSAACPAAWRLARRAGGGLWAALAPRAPRPAPPSPPASDRSDDSDESDDYLSADDGDSELAEDDIEAKLEDMKIGNL